MLRFVSGFLAATLALAGGLVTIVDLVLIPRITAGECWQYRSAPDRINDRGGRVVGTDSGTCDQVRCTAEVRAIDRFVYPDGSTTVRTAGRCD